MATGPGKNTFLVSIGRVALLGLPLAAVYIVYLLFLHSPNCPQQVKPVYNPDTIQLSQHLSNAPFPEYLQPWLAYATEHSCLIHTGYEQILKDLEPLREIAYQGSKFFTESDWCTPRGYFCSVVSGNLTCTDEPHGPHARSTPVHDGMRTYQALLPNMTFCVNKDDLPRVRIQPDAITLPELHQTLSQTCEGYDVGDHWKGIQPIMSFSKILGCHHDVIFPQIIERISDDPNLPEPHTALSVPWKKKVDKVTWRGSSTGAFVREDGAFRNTHRFRLVKQFGQQGVFGDKVKSDIGFSSFVQCDLGPEGCAALCNEYNCLPKQPFTDFFKSKYIVDVDGNSITERYERLLLGGSVILKVTAFTGWWKDRMIPFKHYIPIDFSLKGLAETVDWLHNNEEAAAEIGRASLELALNYMRDVDQDCYVLRLLLEYNELFQRE